MRAVAAKVSKLPLTTFALETDIGFEDSCYIENCQVSAGLEMSVIERDLDGDAAAESSGATLEDLASGVRREEILLHA